MCSPPSYGRGSKQLVRILVATAPLSYREVFAFSLQSQRPRAEVRIAHPDCLHQEVESFGPHLVVCNDTGPEQVRRSVPSWVTIWFHDSLDATISVDGQDPRLVQDIGTDELLAIIDETERLLF